MTEHTQTNIASRFVGAHATLMRWTEAVAAGRIDDIPDLYANDAILVPTLSDEIIVTEDRRRRYFGFLLSDGGPACTVDQEEYRIDCTLGTVVIGGIYTFRFHRPTGKEKLPARFLFNFENIDTHWLITGHHSSRCITNSS